MTLIFIWALLSAPYDRLMCSMWVGAPPTQAVLASAGCVWTPEQAAEYVWRGVEIGTRRVACERPASELPRLTCDLWPLDHYLLRVYDLDYRQQLCSLTIRHTGPPTQDEIDAQCPEITEPYTAEWVSSGPDTPPEPPAPVCPLPALTGADLPASIATNNDYFLLDYELRWWLGADYDITAWQNQYDTAILKAGAAQNVPPRLIKGMLAQESQFWPLWNPERRHGDEVGLGQLTDRGADLALRYSPALYNQLCPIAAWDCSAGYDHLPDPTRRMLRDILRGRLMVSGAPRQAAAQAENTIPVWAQILAAYYCAAGEIVRPAGVAPSWDYALAAYHSGPECVRGGNICESGKGYIEEVKK
jgi:hypothetical protein